MTSLYSIRPNFRENNNCSTCKYRNLRHDGYGGFEWIGCNFGNTRQNYLSLLQEWLRTYEVSEFNVCDLWEE